MALLFVTAVSCMLVLSIMLLIKVGLVPGKRIGIFLKEHETVQIIIAIMFYAGLMFVFIIERGWI